MGALLVLPGCGRKERARPAVSPQVSAAVAAARSSCASANIVIVCVDAARRDHIGCYGYDRPTTPEIDKIAAQGIRFETPVTDASYTHSAIASLWTGQYPDTHGFATVQWRLPLKVTTLPEACRATGMRTAVISSSGAVVKPFGFADGVDDFMSLLRPSPGTGQIPDLQQAWGKWLDGIGSQRFFLYVHLMPPHHPYEWSGPFRGKFDPDYRGRIRSTQQILFDLDAGKTRVTERDREHIIAMYDEALRYSDWAVGRLVDDLRKRGLLDKTLLIVLSDHGEGFGEHGRWLHRNTVYNELTHNFIVMRLPAGVKGARKQVPGLAQLCDLAPTLATLTGFKLPSGQIQGRDLASQIFGGPVTREAAFSRSVEGSLRSVEIRGAKGIFDWQGRLLELYDLTSDPAEKTNIVGKRPRLQAHIIAAFQAWAARQEHMRPPGRPSPMPQLNPETKKWLRSLGYL